MSEKKLYFGRIKTKDEIFQIAERSWDESSKEFDIILKGDNQRQQGWLCDRNYEVMFGKFVTFYREVGENRFVYVKEDNDWGWPKWAIDEISDTSFDKI